MIKPYPLLSLFLLLLLPRTSILAQPAQWEQVNLTYTLEESTSIKFLYLSFQEDFQNVIVFQDVTIDGNSIGFVQRLNSSDEFSIQIELKDNLPSSSLKLTALRKIDSPAFSVEVTSDTTKSAIPIPLKAEEVIQ